MIIAIYLAGVLTGIFLTIFAAAVYVAAEPYHEPEPLPLCRNEDLPH